MKKNKRLSYLGLRLVLTALVFSLQTIHAAIDSYNETAKVDCYNHANSLRCPDEYSLEHSFSYFLHGYFREYNVLPIKDVLHIIEAYYDFSPQKMEQMRLDLSMRICLFKTIDSLLTTPCLSSYHMVFSEHVYRDYYVLCETKDPKASLLNSKISVMSRHADGCEFEAFIPLKIDTKKVCLMKRNSIETSRLIFANGKGQIYCFPLKKDACHKLITQSSKKEGYKIEHITTLSQTKFVVGFIKRVDDVFFTYICALFGNYPNKIEEIITSGIKQFSSSEYLLGIKGPKGSFILASQSKSNSTLLYYTFESKKIKMVEYSLDSMANLKFITCSNDHVIFYQNGFYACKFANGKLNKKEVPYLKFKKHKVRTRSKPSQVLKFYGFIPAWDNRLVTVAYDDSYPGCHYIRLWDFQPSKGMVKLAEIKFIEEIQTIRLYKHFIAIRYVGGGGYMKPQVDIGIIKLLSKLGRG